MAVDKPTVEEFTTRFPQFSSTDEEIISQVINEAANAINDGWRQVDQKPAVLYLTAHMLSTENNSDEAGRTIQSESFGPLSVSYGNGGSESKYATTTFGQRYVEIRNRNVAGIAIV